MKLGESGESRVRGYLYVFERSLRTFLPRDVTADAVREIESHIREVVAQTEASPDEREALDRVLAQLGTPLRVAQAYSLELVIDEATTTGRVAAVVRSLGRVAATGVTAFFASLGLFVAYATGIALLVVAALKPVFPQNVGIWMHNGMPRSVGAQFPAPTGLDLVGGYWVVPMAVVLGGAVLIVTHALARRWLSSVKLRMFPQSRFSA